MYHKSTIRDVQFKIGTSNPVVQTPGASIVSCHCSVIYPNESWLIHSKNEYQIFRSSMPCLFPSVAVWAIACKLKRVSNAATNPRDLFSSETHKLAPQNGPMEGHAVVVPDSASSSSGNAGEERMSSTISCAWGRSLGLNARHRSTRSCISTGQPSSLSLQGHPRL